MAKTQRRGAGMGGLYKDASTGLWVGSLSLPAQDGKRRRKVVRHRTQAGVQTKLRELRKELDRAGDLVTASPTLATWLDLWLDTVAAKRLRPKTLIGYRGDIDLHIKPVIGRVRLDKLTAGHVLRMHDAVTGKGLSSTTALRCHRILSVALRDAMRQGRVTRNVATSDYVDAPTPSVPAIQPIDTADALAVLRTAALDPMYGARWFTTLLTGARRGEVLGLEADRIDLGDADAGRVGSITISWQLQRLRYEHGCGRRSDAGAWPCGHKRGKECPQGGFRAPADYEKRQVHGGLHLVRPKSRAGWRVVPLVEPLRTVLERHLNGRTTGLAFLEPDGDPIDPRDDGPRWAELLQRAGVPHSRMHDARHMAATLLMEAGVDRKVVSQVIGHSSAVTTMGYQHVNLALASDAMRAFSARLGYTPADQPAIT